MAGPPTAQRDRETRGHQQPTWKSSLDLVWSYSRSQAFYAENIGTSPSFVEHYIPSASDEEQNAEASDSFDDDDYSDEDEEDYSGEEDGSGPYHGVEYDSFASDAPADESIPPSGSETGSDAGETTVDLRRPTGDWQGEQLPSNARVPIKDDRAADLLSQRSPPAQAQGLSNLSRAALQARNDKLRNLADDDGTSADDSADRGRGRNRSSASQEDGLLRPPPSAQGVGGHRLSAGASSASSGRSHLGARQSRSQSSSTSRTRRSNVRTGRASGTRTRASIEDVDPKLLPAGHGHVVSHTSTVSGDQAPLLNAKRRSSGMGLASRRRSTLVHPHAAPGVAYPAGTSTFLQSWFNTLNAVMGVGILAMPLAFSYAGWIGGPVLFIICGGLTNYTGKVLYGILARNGRLKTYADIGSYAFGPRARAWVSTLFCLELWAVCVALVILFADSLHAIFPHGPGANLYKIVCLAFVLPTIFLPLKLLSPVSVVGILSALTLVAVVLVDGIIKPSAPGSLWEWDPSGSLRPDWARVPLAFGLIMSGFSSHPVIPSLARDMQEPIRFPNMLDRAYAAATVLYLTMGAAGYAMFGTSVSDEITKDLARTPDFPPTLNKIAVWLIVINPLSKFALAARPVINTFETALGVDEPPVPHHHTHHRRLSRRPSGDEEGYGAVNEGRRLSRKLVRSSATFRRSIAASNPDGNTKRPNSLATAPTGDSSVLGTDGNLSEVVEEGKWYRFGRTAVQVSVSVLITLTAIALPGFEKVMAFLGSFLVITTCVLGPLLAKLKLFGREMSYIHICLDLFILAGSAVAAVIGTIWAFAD